jgi:hypothetical protein
MNVRSSSVTSTVKSGGSLWIPDTRHPPGTRSAAGPSIPEPQNENVGGDLGRLTVNMRINDYDPYYVATPLFDENCENVEERCEVG